MTEAMVAECHAYRRDEPHRTLSILKGKITSGAPVGIKGNRGRPWLSLFARKPKSARRAILRAPWTFPVAAYHLAAIQVRLSERVQGISCPY